VAEGPVSAQAAGPPGPRRAGGGPTPHVLGYIDGVEGCVSGTSHLLGMLACIVLFIAAVGVLAQKRVENRRRDRASIESLHVDVRSLVESHQALRSCLCDESGRLCDRDVDRETE